ncbi:MAG: benzoate/H(+) symporter BenE family transporter [Armatimonadota bacterium]|nr:benzoate/H(+) symporter BenE family transporter [Armatimonadota bacterium]
MSEPDEAAGLAAIAPPLQAVPGGPAPVLRALARNLGDLPRALAPGGVASAVVAWLWSLSPLLITLAAAQQAGLSEARAISWIATVQITGGALSIVLSLRYRQPIVGAFTIPGVVLVGTALRHLPFEEVVGTYWLAGAVLVLLGVSGLVERVTARLPLPIMMGMVAGVLLPFVGAIVRGVQQAPAVGGLTVAAFFAAWVVPGLRRLPPVLVALVTGLVSATVLGQADWGALTVAIGQPQAVVPAFSVAAAAELVVPLVLMVVGVQNVQGIAALTASGYRPPVSSLTTASGVGSLASALFGAHSACIAGPSTAIVAGPASGPLDRRYAVSVLLGVLWIATGLLAPAVTAVTRLVPRALVDVLGGLALLGPMAQFFQQAFGGRFLVGALVAFLVATSGLVVLRIAAPFWALVAGMCASLLVERSDFAALGPTSPGADGGYRRASARSSRG